MNLLKDIEFEKSRQVLASKQKQLKSLGLGSKLNTTEVLEDEHLERMHEKKVLGGHDGYSLTHSRCLICTTYFDMPTGKTDKLS